MSENLKTENASLIADRATVIILLFITLITSCANGQQLWSDTSTWGGIKPTVGSNIIIPIGKTIILDENTPPLGGITINGKLEFARANLTLTAAWIMVHGELRVGTAEIPFAQRATITLTGNDPNESVMGMGTRGIMVMGGKLELYGTPPNFSWTKINNHAIRGTYNLTLKDTVNWNIGDEIVIAPTDYYMAANSNSISQKNLINASTGTYLTLQDSTRAFRWGLLQYATPLGLSLNNTNIINSPSNDTLGKVTPKILDERAPVGNLTRNIVIQSSNDNLWLTQGFGVHVMIMGMGAEAHLNGVEIKRGGQRGRLGRYPFHWHMLSYSGANTLPDAAGQYIKNSTINVSTNRGIVIHGTNGVLVQQNVVFDILGHGIFTEDAVERRNIIDGNLVLKVRNPPLPGLKRHETGEKGASGFWISNPDNTITNNTAADCGSFGFWLAFTTQPWGESKNVLHTDGLLLNPSRTLFGIFNSNVAHSNKLDGIRLDDVEVDSLGTVFPFQYQSTTTGRNAWGTNNLRRFALQNYKVWKNGMSGIWDRAVWADNYGIVSADNCGRFFAGSGADGLIEKSLVIGTSLNHMMNGTNRPLFNDATGGNQTPAAFATYHSAFDIKDNIVINFPITPNTRSGVFATEDYYIRPVEKGQIRNKNNIIINAHPGVKLKAMFNYFALAGALQDPNGNWSGVNDTNQYFVYNTPFFTYGQIPKIVLPDTSSGGVLVKGPFYGVNDFEINRANNPQEDLMAIKVTRFNENLDSVGSWIVNQASATTQLLAHMRHFAMHPSSIYKLDFPTIDTVSDVAFSIENMLSSKDTIIIGIEYSGAFNISQVYISSFPNFMSDGHANWPTSYDNKHIYSKVSTFEEVAKTPSSRVYYHDRCNNMVWVKIQGGIKQIWNDTAYGQLSEERLYRKFNLRVYGTRYSIPLTTATINSIPPIMGCDSIILPNITGIQLTGNQAFYSKPKKENGIKIGNKMFNSATIWAYDTGATCTNEVPVNIQVNNSSTSILNVFNCGVYTSPNSKVYNKSGQYFDTFINHNGCDSVVRINLTIGDYTDTVNITECDYYVTSTGVVLDSNGIYKLMYKNTSGCDSTIYLNLKLYSTRKDIFINTCEKYLGPDGKSYDSSGVYIINLPKNSKCDSTLVLHLEILANKIYIDTTVCDFYVSSLGDTITSSGKYMFELKNGYGCDSSIQLSLLIDSIDFQINIFNDSLGTDYQAESYQWLDCSNNFIQVDGAIRASFKPNKSGIYTLAVTNATGCVDTSSCVSMQLTGLNENTFDKIIIFPNPTDKLITINGLKIETRYEISLLDIMGNEVLTRVTIGEENNKLSLESLSSGIYILKVIESQSVVCMKLVIKK